MKNRFGCYSSVLGVQLCIFEDLPGLKSSVEHNLVQLKNASHSISQLTIDHKSLVAHVLSSFPDSLRGGAFFAGSVYDQRLSSDDLRKLHEVTNSRAREIRSLLSQRQALNIGIRASCTHRLTMCSGLKAELDEAEISYEIERNRINANISEHTFKVGQVEKQIPKGDALTSSKKDIMKVTVSFSYKRVKVAN